MAAISRKKGEFVHMYAFTGMHLGEYEIARSNKDTIIIEQRNGKVTEFSRETGKQLNPKIERCASFVTEEKLPPKPVKKAAPEKKPSKR